MSSWPGNLQMRHRLALPVMLVAVIVAVYYPAMLSGVHPVDDPGIIEFYGSSPRLSQILLPGLGYYYRPLLELSFWLDHRLWGLEPRVMHLENILLHCANALLVLLLARRVNRAAGHDSPFLPLLAALLFALHPVNVEAVSWIAGRSDLLLCLAVLCACCLWVRWLEEGRRLDLGAAFFLFGAALLTKETALAAGAVALVLALAWPGVATVRQRLTALAGMALPGVLFVGFALLYRSGTSAFGRFASAAEPLPVQALWQAVAAVGFYARKLVLPLPLNFAITGVDPAYALPGLLLVPALSFLLWRRRVAGALVVSGFLMVLPALVVAVRPIAWTPVAERYLYLPSAFVVLGLAALPTPQRYRVPAATLALLLVAACAFVGGQRTMLWKDKRAFLEDAVAKSPSFGSLYNELGGILADRGEVERAAEAFAAAERLNQRPSMDLLIKGNLMRMQCLQGNYSGVRARFYRIFTKKEDAPAVFLELLLKADSRRLNTLAGAQKQALAKDLLETLDLLNKKRYDPFWLYRSGQIWLVLGDPGRAAGFFARAYREAPADAHYRRAASTYLQRLETIR